MRILLLADIHIGSIKDVNYVYRIITDIVEKEVIFKHTDMIVILGDYFDKLIKGNEDYVSCAVNVMAYIVRACHRSNTKIRLIYGTEGHEMSQYRIFNYHITSKNIDFKVIDTVTPEIIDGTKILYVPEEYVNDKNEFYKKYLYSGVKYDYIFGHGMIAEIMPKIMTYGVNSNKEKHVSVFNSDEFSSISKITVFGHYHIHKDFHGNVHYLGSLFRTKFGEEEPKGYGIIEDDKFEFIENKEAYVYKTYEFNETSPIFKSPENIINEIQKIKEENSDMFAGKIIGKIRIKLTPPNNLDPTFRENIRSILFNEKFISTEIKESAEDLISEVKEEIGDEMDFVIDKSLNIIEKIQRFIKKKYNYEISIEDLKKYIEG